MSSGACVLRMRKAAMHLRTLRRGRRCWRAHRALARIGRRRHRRLQGLALARHARGDDRHAHAVAERLVEGRADNDVGFRIDLLAHAAGRLVHLVERQIAAAGDRQQQALGALQRDVVEQRIGDRLLGRDRCARCSPDASPVPITAEPMPLITVRTSAKSRLIRPSLMIRSTMQATPE